MVFTVHDEYVVLRLSQENTVPPRLAKLGRRPVEYINYGFEQATYNAAISSFNDWTTYIITYSWDIEMTQCIFRVKQVCLPRLAERPNRLYVIELDMFSGQIVILADRVCTVLTTV
jgi:hypothetical protein